MKNDKKKKIFQGCLYVLFVIYCCSVLNLLLFTGKYGLFETLIYLANGTLYIFSRMEAKKILGEKKVYLVDILLLGAVAIFALPQIFTVDGIIILQARDYLSFVFIATAIAALVNYYISRSRVKKTEV